MAINTKVENTDLAPTNTTPPAPAPMNASERFTSKVLKEFGSTVAGPVEVTEFQKKLIQGYFIAVDRALKTAEDERIRKNDKNRDHKYDNDLPVTWENVNLTDLALDAVHYARMGLDMMQDNHLFPIPYKNNKTRKYDMTLMVGYNGIRYIAEKYALEPPIAVTTELVYSTDEFTPIKKSIQNRVESYLFEIKQPFDRGEIVGGFGYIEYADASRNELIIMPLSAILKRKPKYASPNFWGGTVNNEKVEGWFDEMCLKTLIREVYSSKHIPRDPQKIDESYQYMKLREAQIAEMQAQEDVDAYANGDVIDTTPALPPSAPSALPPAAAAVPVNMDTGEILAPVPEPAALPRQEAPSGQQMMMGGPEF